MDNRDKWNLIHEYRTLGSLGAVPEIKCPNCDDDMIPVVDTDGSPALQCISERTLVHPGLHVYDQIIKNIADFKATIRPVEKK